MVTLIEHAKMTPKKKKQRTIIMRTTIFGYNNWKFPTVGSQLPLV